MWFPCFAQLAGTGDRLFLYQMPAQLFNHLFIAPCSSVWQVRMDLPDRNGQANTLIKVMFQVDLMLFGMEDDDLIIGFFLRLTESCHQKSIVGNRHAEIIQAPVALYHHVAGHSNGYFHKMYLLIQGNLHVDISIRYIEVQVFFKERFADVVFKPMNSFFQSLELNNILILKFQNN